MSIEKANSFTLSKVRLIRSKPEKGVAGEGLGTESMQYRARQRRNGRKRGMAVSAVNYRCG
jgi:hypothetical protein